MKIAVIGGGSSYTPELMEGIINHKDSLPVTEVVLIDIPEGQEKVSINTAFAKRMAEKAGLPISVRYTLDRREGLKDASFVIAQIRVGGLDAREKDERIPLKYDVIGQETTGPGGFFKALRTIPVMLSICRDMEEVCKDAWLINFTNPSGIITEAILKNTKVKCIGLCNVSINMRYDAAERLSVSPDELDCRFIGLNHLSVMNHAYYQGKDRILDAVSVENTESVVKNIQKDAEMDAVAKELGCLLSPYMQYFYTEKEALQHEKMEAIGLTGTRAAQVKEVEKNLFECYKDINLREKPAALAKRGGARYSMAAICLIDSIYNDTNDVQVVDVFNNGIIPQLPDDVVIEVNCRIGRNGAAPLASDVLGLIGQVKAYEEYTIEAAITGDRNKALIALLNNPLIHDVRDAKGILNELLEAHRAYLPAFFQ